ncbi:hypothetical protein J1614_009202 [Plenodomus biglobosus]|nr:hypothetical protein J1614_009202 [Plenodomus biglobosus]
MRRTALLNGSNGIRGLLGSSGGRKVSHHKRLLVITSHDQGGIARVAQVLSSHLATIQATTTPDYVAKLAYTLGTKRSKLIWKYSCIASSLEQLQARLTSLPDNAAVRSNKTPSLGFISTGQGAQCARMGVELLDRPVFKASVNECDAHLASLGCSWRLIDELNQMDKSRIDKPERSQTLCALQKLDAVSVAYLRGVASATLKKVAPQYDGGMMVAGSSEHEVEDLISHMGATDLTIACVNSPVNVTISGSMQHLKRLKTTSDEKSIFARRLAINVAYHSDHVQEIYPCYVQALGHIHGIPRARGADGPAMFSSADGGQAVQLMGAFYCGRNLTNTVYFSDALTEMVSTPTEDKSALPFTNAIDILVEIEPHSALAGPVKEVLEKNGIKGIDYQSARPGA